MLKPIGCQDKFHHIVKKNSHWLCAHCVVAVRTGSSNTIFYPAVRTGSSNTRFFFWWSLAPDLRSVKTILAGNFVRLEFIRQNFHHSWCRKLLVI